LKEGLRILVVRQSEEAMPRLSEPRECSVETLWIGAPLDRCGRIASDGELEC
jgi:hypothetical protein